MVIRNNLPALTAKNKNGYNIRKAKKARRNCPPDTE